MNYAFPKYQYVQYVHGQSLDALTALFTPRSNTISEAEVNDDGTTDGGSTHWVLNIYSTQSASPIQSINDGAYVVVTPSFGLQFYSETTFNENFSTENPGGAVTDPAASSVTVSLGTISVPLSDYVTIQVPIGDVTGTIGASDPLPIL